MKKLIFINDSFKMSKSQLEKFIYLLKEENLLKKNLPFIEKRVGIDELFFYLKDNISVSLKNNEILYNNVLTKERTSIYQFDDSLYIEIKSDYSSLFKYFYYNRY